MLGPSLIVNVPATASLVGFAAGLQGFALGCGPCPLQPRCSDTLDFRVLRTPRRGRAPRRDVPSLPPQRRHAALLAAVLSSAGRSPATYEAK